MLARNEIIFKWLLYTLAALACLWVQTALLQRITVWGVIPFLYPLIATIPATYEGPLAGSIFALVVGVICDSLLPDAFPCLYTLIFPLAGMCAGLLSRSLLPAGFICSFTVTAAAFLFTDTFRCFLLWINRKAAWGGGFSVMAWEFLITAPLLIPMTVLFRAVHRKAHEND